MANGLQALTVTCPHCDLDHAVDLSEGPLVIPRGRYALDLVERLIRRDGRAVTERFGRGDYPMQIFALFWLQRRRLLTTTAIHQAIYGLRPYADQPADKIVQVYISHLRSWLRGNRAGFAIETCHGHGYRLVWPNDIAPLIGQRAA